jgi:hypothetical protein
VRKKVVKPGPPAAVAVVRVPGEGDREAIIEEGREDLLGRVDDEGEDVGEENMSSKGRIAEMMGFDGEVDGDFKEGGVES